MLMDILGWINRKIVDCWHLWCLCDSGQQDFHSTLPNSLLFIKAKLGHLMQIMLYCIGLKITFFFLTKKIISCVIWLRDLISLCLYKKSNNERETGRGQIVSDLNCQVEMFGFPYPFFFPCCPKPLWYFSLHCAKWDFVAILKM